MTINNNIVYAYVAGWLATTAVGAYLSFNLEDNSSFAGLGFVFGMMTTIIVAFFWPIAVPYILWAHVVDTISDRAEEARAEKERKERVDRAWAMIDEALGKKAK